MVTINEDVLAKEKIAAELESTKSSEQIFNNDMVKQTTNEGVKENRKQKLEKYENWNSGRNSYGEINEHTNVKKNSVCKCRKRKTKIRTRSTRFFAFVSSLKLGRRLLCSVRFIKYHR
jgi:hypothetical protein